MYTYIPVFSVLVDFGDEVCSELLAQEEDDPSIAFSPGPADVAERYVWKRDSEIYLHQRQPVHVGRASSSQKRIDHEVASMKYSQKVGDHITVRTFSVTMISCIHNMWHGICEIFRGAISMVFFT